MDVLVYIVNATAVYVGIHCCMHGFELRCLCARFGFNLRFVDRIAY